MTVSTRRSFLQSSAAAGLFVSSVRAARRRGALEKLNIACIGTANRAAADIEGVISENIVALCDVDSRYLERSQKMIREKQGHDPAVFADYREMIDRLADRFDAVVIGTTDHHHAPATVRAIRAGKHVYCEKPLTHTVHEARVVAEEAKKAGVATQLGTQIHAGSNYRRVVEIIQSGAIGAVSEVHVWVGKGWGGGALPSQGDPVPKHLNWDLWLGPAPVRDYKDSLYHPAQWRRWWDFGGGTLADMACHYMDLPFWALGLSRPVSCRAEGPEVDAHACPSGLRVFYRFPARGSQPAVDLTWYDGNRLPGEIHGQRVPGAGVLFVGTEGMMFADYTRYRLFPQEKFAGFTPPPQTIPPSVGHHREWIEACISGTPTTCDFAYSGPLTEAVQLGNVAYRCGEALEWDAENLKASNTDAADRFIRKEYRAGWEVA